jgi:hypothetical protein
MIVHCTCRKACLNEDEDYYFLPSVSEISIISYTFVFFVMYVKTLPVWTMLQILIFTLFCDCINIFLFRINIHFY